MSPIRLFLLVHLSLLLRFILPTTCSPSPSADGRSNKLVLNEVHPGNPCLSVNVTWTGGIPPFNVSISPEPAGMGRGGINATINDSRGYCWTPSFPSGAAAHIIISDSTRPRSQIVSTYLLDGSNTTCISHTSTSSEPSQSTTSEATTNTTPLGSPVESSSSHLDTSVTTQSASVTAATPSPSSSLSFSRSGSANASVRDTLHTSPASDKHSPQSTVITMSPAATSISAGSGIQSYTPSSRSRKALSSGAISGIVLGTITLLATLTLLIYCACARRRREDLTQGMCFEYYIAKYTMSDNMSIVCYYTVLQHAVRVGTSPQEKPSSNRLLQSATIRRSSGCSSLHWTSGQRRTECDPSQHGVSFHLYYPSRGTIFIALIPTSRTIPQIPQFQRRFHLYDLIPHPCR